MTGSVAGSTYLVEAYTGWPSANQTTLAKAPGCPRFNGWPSLYYGDGQPSQPNPDLLLTMPGGFV